MLGSASGRLDRGNTEEAAQFFLSSNQAIVLQEGVGFNTDGTPVGGVQGWGGERACNRAGIVLQEGVGFNADGTPVGVRNCRVRGWCVWGVCKGRVRE